MTMLQATTIGAAFVFGMVLALLGSLKLALASASTSAKGASAFCCPPSTPPSFR